MRRDGLTLDWTVRAIRGAALASLALAVLLFASGCTDGQGAADSGTANDTPGAHMAGPAVDVNVTQAVLDAKPQAADLRTPESAIRSHLDWSSYAYRIGQSAVATQSMSAEHEVLVDSYIQLNLQQKRLLDQTLVSIAFGKPDVTDTSAIVPAKESWTYRYLSVEKGNRSLGGPYSASYETTYTVVKAARGWVVDKVEVKALGPVK